MTCERSFLAPCVHLTTVVIHSARGPLLCRDSCQGGPSDELAGEKELGVEADVLKGFLVVVAGGHEEMDPELGVVLPAQAQPPACCVATVASA